MAFLETWVLELAAVRLGRQTEAQSPLLLLWERRKAWFPLMHSKNFAFKDQPTLRNMVERQAARFHSLLVLALTLCMEPPSTISAIISLTPMTGLTITTKRISLPFDRTTSAVHSAVLSRYGSCTTEETAVSSLSHIKGSDCCSPRRRPCHMSPTPSCANNP